MSPLQINRVSHIATMLHKEAGKRTVLDCVKEAARRQPFVMHSEDEAIIVARVEATLREINGGEVG